ncbi:MAG: ATP-binding protein [Magnetococcales bacterium]|nr:ATP-binding protein [Magnetococcales bacterium]MBF0437866.1 ATP-binding protein [Magnetococcales bacterium]
MATAEQIVALLKSYSDKDDVRFLSVAMQIAAHESRQGHKTMAKELMDLIDRVKENRSSIPVNNDPIPIIRPKGELTGLLTANFSKDRIGDLAVSLELKNRLAQILIEQRQRDKIQAYGLLPRHKVLLIGPPGTGKTLTARILAGELHIPLFTIRLDTVITKFMGETAAKLRLIFDAIAQTRGVYLFDEFDAIGSHRDSNNDVGEVRRILNSFLQFMEEDCSNSVIVAATNHPNLLDSALFRRFDDVLEYTLPDTEEITTLLTSHLARFNTKDVEWSTISHRAVGLSHAEVVQSAKDAAKNAILQDHESIKSSMVINAIDNRTRKRNNMKN